MDGIVWLSEFGGIIRPLPIPTQDSGTGPMVEDRGELVGPELARIFGYGNRERGPLAGPVEQQADLGGDHPVTREHNRNPIGPGCSE